MTNRSHTEKWQSLRSNDKETMAVEDKRRKRKIFETAIRVLAFVLVTFVSVNGTQAQGSETIAYGSSVIGNITSEVPFAIYSFNMNAGDVMTLSLAALSPDLLLEASMVGPDQHPAATSSNDPFSAVRGHIIRIDYRASLTGNYTLIVTNLQNAPGQFLLILDGRSGTVETTLSPNDVETGILPPNSEPLVYSFRQSPDSQLLLGFQTNTPGFSFLIRVYDGGGRLVAGLAGTDLRGANLEIGPGNGQYVVEVDTLTQGVQGAVEISLVPGWEEPDGAVPTMQIPVVTPTPSVCQVTGNNRVNVRSGPGTVYPAFGSLYPGTSLNVVGRNSVTTWYVVDYNGHQGWVADSVVDISGPCEMLPFVPDPPVPATATPLPTSTSIAPTVSFTSTVGSGVTYAPGTCFTFYWSATNVREIYFDGQGVTGQGQTQVCPTTTRSYALRVVNLDGTVQDFLIPVSISP